MLFITGTDTGVGKTYFTSLLIRQLRAAGLDAAGCKPLCCGDREDPRCLVSASDERLSINECNPVWMRFPASPYTASIIEEKQIDLALIREQLGSLKKRFPALVVEGVGGWCVPILRDYSSVDLARELGYPVFLVAANRLGMLNHTLLTLQAIAAAGLRCVGVLLNNGVTPQDTITATNRSVLEELLSGTGVPVLGEIESGATALPPAVFKKIVELQA